MYIKNTVQRSPCVSHRATLHHIKLLSRNSFRWQYGFRGYFAAAAHQTHAIHIRSHRVHSRIHSPKEKPTKFLQNLMRNKLNSFVVAFFSVRFCFRFNFLSQRGLYIADISIHANVHLHQTRIYRNCLCAFEAKRIVSPLSWSSLAGIWLFICITWKISNHTIHLNPIQMFTDYMRALQK